MADPQQQIAELFARLPILFRLGALLPALALPVWWWWSYSGLYRMLAEFQLSTMGSYTVVLTGLLTVLTVLVPVFIGLALIARAMPAADGDRVAADKKRSAAINAWIQNHRFSTIAGIAGFGVMLFGAAMFVDGWSMGERADLPIERLERGEHALSRWVLAQGRALHERAIWIEFDDQVTTYVPLVSSSWDGGPVHAFAMVEQQPWGTEAFVMPVEGTIPVTWSGFARAELERGGIVVAPDAIAIAVDKTPGDHMGLGGCLAAGGGVIWVGVLAVARIRRRA